VKAGAIPRQSGPMCAQAGPRGSRRAENQGLPTRVPSADQDALATRSGIRGMRGDHRVRQRQYFR
jgi:hypothetical protein